MTKSDLALQFGAGLRYVHFVISYKDLQATTGSGAKSIQLADQDNPSLTFNITSNGVTGGGKILGVAVRPTVSFAGGSLSAMTVSLGVTGALTRFTTAYDVFQAVGDTVLQETPLFKLGQFSSTALQATFTPTSDNCSAATAGSVSIDICYLDLSTTGTLPN